MSYPNFGELYNGCARSSAMQPQAMTMPGQAGYGQAMQQQTMTPQAMTQSTNPVLAAFGQHLLQRQQQTAMQPSPTSMTQQAMSLPAMDQATVSSLGYQTTVAMASAIMELQKKVCELESCNETLECQLSCLKKKVKKLNVLVTCLFENANVVINAGDGCADGADSDKCKKKKKKRDCCPSNECPQVTVVYEKDDCARNGDGHDDSNESDQEECENESKSDYVTQLAENEFKLGFAKGAEYAQAYNQAQQQQRRCEEEDSDSDDEQSQSRSHRQVMPMQQLQQPPQMQPMCLIQQQCHQDEQDDRDDSDSDDEQSCSGSSHGQSHERTKSGSCKMSIQQPPMRSIEHPKSSKRRSDNKQSGSSSSSNSSSSTSSSESSGSKSVPRRSFCVQTPINPVDMTMTVHSSHRELAQFSPPIATRASGSVSSCSGDSSSSQSSCSQDPCEKDVDSNCKTRSFSKMFDFSDACCKSNPVLPDDLTKTFTNQLAQTAMDLLC